MSLSTECWAMDSGQTIRGDAQITFPWSDTNAPWPCRITLQICRKDSASCHYSFSIADWSVLLDEQSGRFSW